MPAAQTAVARTPATSKPRLVFFTEDVSGYCRRVEGFLAQVLQRRQNHSTFKLYVVDRAARPDLVERFEISEFPTLVVIDGRRERARLVRPRGCKDIESTLAPWLR